MQEGWYSKTKEEIFNELETSEKGLTNNEAKERLKKYGLNEITKKKGTNPFFIFLKQFNSPLVYILFIAMIISFIFKHLVDAYVILIIILINSIIGFIEERKAERAIEALKKMIVSYAKVFRSGQVLKIPASQVVPGDLLLLEEGDKVPADARLIEIKNFRTQESSLTGESFPEEKSIKILSNESSVGDRTNMVFLSTFVVSGEAKAIVVSTADKTQIGLVAESIQEVIQPKMHFNEKVSQLAIQMTIFASIGAGLTFIIGYFINKLEFFEIFLFTIASLVSGIPEGLPAVLVIVLAIGARRMAKHNAVVRHLPAVETLGVATVISTDKTGTLTQNSMAVENITTFDEEFSITGNGWMPLGKFLKGKISINPLKNETLKKVFSISFLCNKSNLFRKEDNYEPIGDPTEVALLVLGKKAGLRKEELQEEIVDDFPFSSELKFRATLVKNKKLNNKQLYVVGAFEEIIKNSSQYYNGKKINLSPSEKDKLLEKSNNLAKKGLRVLALAYKDLPATTNSVSPKQVSNLVFVSIVGMKDPPRKEVKDAITKAKNAGIRVIMNTGDHKETAIAIAKEIGLVQGKIKAYTEKELEDMDDSEFNNALRESDIFARVSPKMKLRIVKTLQEQGEIVAMTGDGVNDAPSLKRADIGISMGIIGTDVARESSEIVLTDDNFASIVNAIEEGRTVFRNVRRTSFFLITTNVAEDVTIVSSMALGLPLPLITIQLLYLNLVTDTLPGISLSFEPTHKDVLNQPPRNKKEKIINKDLFPFLILTAGLMTLVTIPLFIYFLKNFGLDKARTAAFVSMSMFQIFNVFNLRSIKNSLFKIGVFTNKWVIYGFLLSFLIMLLVIYVPLLAGIFKLIPLSITELIFIIILSSSIFFVGEIYKFFKYGNKIKK